MNATMGTQVRRRPSTWLALGLFGLALGMMGFVAVVTFLPEAEATSARVADAAEAVVMLVSLPTVILIPGVGAVLAIQRPDNAIGWILLVAGIGIIMGIFGPFWVDWSVIVGTELPGYRTIDWLWSPMQSLGFTLLIFWLPLLFPDGRLPSRRWRPLAWVLGITMVVSFVLESIAGRGGDFGRSLDGPVAIDDATADTMIAVLDLMGLVALVSLSLILVSVVVRFRRSRGVERQQM